MPTMNSWSFIVDRENGSTSKRRSAIQCRWIVVAVDISRTITCFEVTVMVRLKRMFSFIWTLAQERRSFDGERRCSTCPTVSPLITTAISGSLTLPCIKFSCSNQMTWSGRRWPLAKSSSLARVQTNSVDQRMLPWWRTETSSLPTGKKLEKDQSMREHVLLTSRYCNSRIVKFNRNGERILEWNLSVKGKTDGKWLRAEMRLSHRSEKSSSTNHDSRRWITDAQSVEHRSFGCFERGGQIALWRRSRKFSNPMLQFGHRRIPPSDPCGKERQDLSNIRHWICASNQWCVSKRETISDGAKNLLLRLGTILFAVTGGDQIAEKKVYMIDAQSGEILTSFDANPVSEEAWSREREKEPRFVSSEASECSSWHHCVNEWPRDLCRRVGNGVQKCPA